MSVILYGLKNCDTCKKATKWLDRFGVVHAFVDYRDHKPSPEMLVEWAGKAGGFDDSGHAVAAILQLPAMLGLTDDQPDRKSVV